MISSPKTEDKPTHKSRLTSTTGDPTTRSPNTEDRDIKNNPLSSVFGDT